MRSVYDNIKLAKAVAPQSVATTATPTTSAVFAVDTFGFNSGMFEVFAGTPTGTTVTYSISVQITECATSGGTYTDVSGATGTITGFGTALAEHCQIRVEGLGSDRKRYLKAVIVPTLSVADKVITVSAVALLGRSFKEPPSNAASAVAAA